MQVGFGDMLYGKATLQIKPSLVFDLKAQTWGNHRFLLDLSLKIPISFKFTLGYDINIVFHFKNDWSHGPFEIANLNFKLVSVRLRSSHNSEIRSLGDFRALNAANESSLTTNESVSVPPCLCATRNATIPWNGALSNATFSSRSSTWQRINAALVDTCEFNTDDVESEALIFTAPVTGYYDVRATVEAISNASTGNRWRAFARINNETGCCGAFTFCASLSAETRRWMGVVYMTNGSSISLSWSSSSAGSDAIITTTFSLDSEPVVYVDSVLGNNIFDGSRWKPVRTLETGLALLATKVGPNVKTATIILMPTLRNNIQHPSTRYMLLCHLVMVCISSLNCRSGYVIPTILRTVSLTITSFIARHATEIFEAWKSFEFYCNYLIEPCVSVENFLASVYGTSFDTGMSLHSYEP